MAKKRKNSSLFMIETNRYSTW